MASDGRVRGWDTLSEDEQGEVRRALASLHIFRLRDAKKKSQRGFLTEEQFAKVCTIVTVKELESGDVVQTEGQPVDSMTLVIDGSLAKFQKGTQKSPDIVEYLREGDQIGQLHMIAGSDRASSSVVVHSESALCAFLAQAELDRLMESDPLLVRVICNNLALALRDHVRRHHSHRLVRMVEQMEGIGMGQVSKDAAAKASGSVHFLSAALSGISSMTLAYPLDVARTLLQTEGRGDIVYGFQMLARLLETEGIGSWYRGWSSHTTSHTLQNAVYHSAYAQITDIVKAGQPKLSDPVRLLLGVAAGCVAASVVTPLSIVTFRLQGPKGRQHNAVTMLLEIVRSDGFFSLWNGLGPSLVLAINPCITFYAFDELKTRALQWKQERGARHKSPRSASNDSFKVKLSPFETLLVGAVAKSIASILTFPLLMAKIRMGLYGREKYPTMLSTFATVLRDEGAGGLFKGVGLSLLRSVAVASLEFVLRDKCLELVMRVAGQAPRPRRTGTGSA